MPDNPAKDYAITRAATDLARQLGRQRKALGFETREDLAALEIALGLARGPSLEIRAYPSGAWQDACSLREFLDANPELERHEVSSLLRLASDPMVESVSIAAGAAGELRVTRVAG